MGGGLKIRRGGRDTHSSGFFMESRRVVGIHKADDSSALHANTLHIVTVSIPRCDRGGAGANPAAGTISSFVRKAKSRASGPQNRVTQCKSGAHVHFSSDTREPAALACLGSKRSPGQHRGIRPFFERRAEGEEQRVQIIAEGGDKMVWTSSLYALGSSLIQPCSSISRARAFEARS